MARTKLHKEVARLRKVVKGRRGVELRKGFTLTDVARGELRRYELFDARLNKYVASFFRVTEA